jgi:hypothetical protein
MENIIELEIRRTSKNLLLFNLGLLIFGILLYCSFIKYYHNFFDGPFQISKQELISISDPTSHEDYFVTIKGDSIFNSGYYQTEQTLDKYSKEVKYESKIGIYNILILNNKLLLVYSKNGESSTTLTGSLDCVPNDLRKKLIDKSKFSNYILLPFMLDTSGFKGRGYFGLIILIPLFLISLWNIQNSIRRLIKPSIHPIYKSFKQFGDTLQVENSIIDEFRRQNQYLKIPKAHLSRNWLVITRFFKTSFVNTNSVIWIYKKHTKHSVNRIPYWNSYKVMLFIKEIKFIEIPCNESEVEYFIKIFYQRNPWLYLGYSEKTNNQLHTNPKEFIQYVEYKKKEILNEIKSS